MTRIPNKGRVFLNSTFHCEFCDRSEADGVVEKEGDG
jgi:hypothetical protein